jgi:hypothetical protein
MKVFCINLDRRSDKWAYVRIEFERMDIRVIRITGIDIKPGWVGCREGHLQIIENNRDEGMCMVFEDDVKFLEPWETIERALSQLPIGWDMLYLGASPKEPQKRYSQNLFRLKNAHCMHAYIINNSNGCMDYVLDHRQNIKKIDDYFATEIQSRFDCFITYPMAVTQIQFSSDTCQRSDVSTIHKNYLKFVG